MHTIEVIAPSAVNETKESTSVIDNSIPDSSAKKSDYHSKLV